MMLMYYLYSLCKFSNMVTDVNKARKWGKKRIDMIKTVVDNDEVVSTWSVHISKYGNYDIVARESERNLWPKS